MKQPVTEHQKFIAMCRRPQVTHACFDCDEIFIGQNQINCMITRGDRKFCFRCAMKRLPRRVCSVCGTTFRVTSARSEFCSQSCREIQL